jgi:2-dehydro-3-deoxygalactonokinase
MKNLLLSCDWGTSSFRLKLVNTADYRVIDQVTDSQGIAATYNEWKSTAASQPTGREDFYLQYLTQHIEKLSARSALSLTSVPVVMSGMACSSIGIRELPYAPLPFFTDGSNAILHLLETRKTFSNELWLISGVHSKYDVMRGEETQMAGLAASFNEEDVVCILPGTHSKHITISAGKITDFTTYMTGELFNIICGHSILKESVLAGGMGHSFPAAFSRGIEKSGDENLLHALFSVRVNRLFAYLTREENFFYLSGLLIGSELSSLLRSANVPIKLCAGRNLSGFYQRAIEELGLSARTQIIRPDVVDNAAVVGQVKIFKEKTKHQDHQ